LYLRTSTITRLLRRKSQLLRVLIPCALIAPIVATKMSTAGYSTQDLRTHVEIDGVNYGAFDAIEGLKEQAARATDDETFRRVTLKRDFVTDPSLYLWAKNIMRSRSDLKDVHIVVENRAGEEISRYVLKYCQPLSWTVEAANPALGGFHEKIDLAVQEISIR
jgi:hypothetical protein